MVCAYTRPRYQVSVNRTICPLVIKFIGKCYSLQPFSSEMKDNRCERIPLI